MSWCEGGDHWSEVLRCGGLLVRASGGHGSGWVVREPEWVPGCWGGVHWSES